MFKRQLKNPIFWCLVSVLLGLTLGIIGWNRNESTGNYKGAGALIWAGVILLVGGLGGWQIFGNRRK